MTFAGRVFYFTAGLNTGLGVLAAAVGCPRQAAAFTLLIVAHAIVNTLLGSRL